MSIVRVALDVPIDTLFDYLADDACSHDVGRRVLVPFGRKQAVGVIMQIADNPQVDVKRLKRLIQTFRDLPPLPNEQLELLRFCSDYYHHPLGEVVMNSLPGRVRTPGWVIPQTATRFHLTPAGLAADGSELPARSMVKRKLLRRLREAGYLDRGQIAEISPRATKVLKELIELGWVNETPEPEAPAAPPEPAGGPTLTSEQVHAVNTIGAGLARFKPWLLHGITGSGKSEVYLHLISRVIRNGGQALVLVPEINLTPQLEALFTARFPGARIASLHSGLNAVQRVCNWLLAQSGRAQIILGTRLAVFTPLPRLGLIIVDEEHDSSFKQQEGLRYSARDVAIFLAKHRNVPVILGSATPSLESYHNAQNGRYELLTLTQRASGNAVLPEICCIDTRTASLHEGLSEPLIRALEGRLQRGEQSLVFINRRGYAPVLTCHACAWVSSCHRCEAKLVLHLRERRLRCHLCGHQEPIPAACPACGNQDLRPLGHGTQRIENALTARFPQARIMRIDRDSTRRKDAWAAMLREIHGRQIDILVGTQILAKGHDFANLTLVGVLNSDSSLYSTDFRASERLFAQLIQVAGRAGRAALPGEVLIQTQFPHHPLFQALRRHDYDAFARDLLAERKHAGFPPYVHQALLRAEALQLDTATAFLARAAKLASEIKPSVEVYDPVPAPIARLAGMERAQLLVQSASRRNLQKFLSGWYAALTALSTRRVRWSLDVDPLEF